MELFTHLSYREREKIYRGLCSGGGVRSIARELGRPPSAVSREIRRNSDHVGYFYPGDAHKAAQERRYVNEEKIVKAPGLKKYIIEKLHARWSPGAIAGSWIRSM